MPGRSGWSGGGLRVSWRPGEPGAERGGQLGDRLPRGRPADLPGEPGTGERCRDDVRARGDRGQAVPDVAERGTRARGEPQPGYLGAVQDVNVYVQVDRQAAEPGQRAAWKSPTVAGMWRTWLAAMASRSAGSRSRASASTMLCSGTGRSPSGPANSSGARPVSKQRPGRPAHCVGDRPVEHVHPAGYVAVRQRRINGRDRAHGTGKSGMCSSRCQGLTIRSQVPLVLSGIETILSAPGPGRRAGAIPHDQAGFQFHAQRLVGVSVELADQHGDGDAAHLLEWLADGGEAG